MKSAVDNTTSIGSLVSEVADRFTEQVKQGLSPSVEQYAKQYPQIADIIRQVFPALAVLDSPTPLVQPQGDGDGVVTGQIGEFRIFGELGRGGMGVVYEAEQLSIGRRVALKVLPFAAMLDKQQLNRFKNEVRAAGTLDHPNIVSVFSVGTERGVHYYAMQLIEGPSLAELIANLRHSLGTATDPVGANEGCMKTRAVTSTHFSPIELLHPLPTDTDRDMQAVISTVPEFDTTEYFRNVALLGIQAAQALGYAHQNGIIHRDIKPGNLLLDASGKIWIADFGLARIEADAGMTMTGDLLGTLRYMSPEQASGERAVVDHRTDIYSLGATLYELLTLCPVFNGTDRQILLQQVAIDEPQPPQRLNKGIPTDLETIVLKALAKSPSERYPSAQELANDLQAFLDNKSICARRPTLLHRVIKWSRRHQGLVTSATILLVLVTIGMAVSTFRISREQGRTANALNQSQANYEEAEAAREDLLEAHDETKRERNEALRLRDQIRYQLYVSQMNLAERAWEEGNVGRVLELLAGQTPEQTGDIDLRGWEWHYQWRLCHTDLRTLPGKSRCVAFSPMGQLLASGDDKDTVTIWDTSSGKAIRSFRMNDGHPYRVDSVAFSPDGQLLATGGAPNSLPLKSVSEGQLVQSLHVSPGFGSSVAFRSDGQFLAVGGSTGVVSLWDPLSGKQRQSFKKVAANIHSVAFSPDGNLLAVGTGNRHREPEQGGISLWDPLVGKERLRFETQSASVNSLAFGPSGKQLASGGRDGSLKLWAPSDGKLVRSMVAHTGGVTDVAFNPSGQSLVTCGTGGTLKFWDPGDGRVLQTLKGHTSTVHGLEYSSDGELLASASDEGIKLWDKASRQEPQSLIGHPHYVHNVAFSPDGQLLASGGQESEVMIWSTTQDRPKLTLNGHVGPISHVAFSHSTLATADDTAVKLWDPDTGQERCVFLGSNNISSVSLSQSGNLLALGDGDGTLRIWDTHNERALQNIEGNSGSILSLTFSPDERRLASCSADNRVRIWDTDNGRQLRSFVIKGAKIKSLAYSPDGQLLATCNRDGLKIWDEREGRLLHQLKGHTDVVLDAAFNPNGNRLASCSADGTVKLWDVSTGQELRTLKAHTDHVQGIAFSTDGMRLVSCSKDRTIKIWDARPLAPQLRADLLKDLDPTPKQSLELVDSKPDDERSVILRATKLVRNGQLQPALDLIAQAKELSAEFPIAVEDQSRLAYSYFRLGRFLSRYEPRAAQYEHAIESVNRAVELEAGLPEDIPRSATYRLSLYRLLSSSAMRTQMTGPDKAEDFYRRALVILNQLAAELGDKFSSRRRIAMMSEKLGGLLVAKQKYEEAQELYKKAIELEPNAGFYSSLAWLMATCPDVQFRNPKQAVKLALKAHRLNPKSAWRLTVLGVAQYRDGQYRVSIESLKKSIPLRSGAGGDLLSHLFTAMAHWKLGEQDEARKSYEVGVALIEKHGLNVESYQSVLTEVAELLGLPVLESEAASQGKSMKNAEVASQEN